MSWISVFSMPRAILQVVARYAFVVGHGGNLECGPGSRVGDVEEETAGSGAVGGGRVVIGHSSQVNGVGRQGALGRGSNHSSIAAAALSRQPTASFTRSSARAYRSCGSSRRRLYMSVTSRVSNIGPAMRRYSSSSIPTLSKPIRWIASGSRSRVVWPLTMSRYTAFTAGEMA